MGTIGDIGGYIEFLKGLKAGVDENTIPAINWKEIRPFLAMEHFTVEIIQSKNSAAAGVCSFVLNIVMVRHPPPRPLPPARLWFPRMLAKSSE